ncbi:MAG: histidine kinase [Bacteroidota bacterium]
MKQEQKNRFAASHLFPNTTIFIPLVLVLTMFSLLASLQSYFILSAETAYYRSFFSALISKTVYYLYFLLPAYVVSILAAVFPLQRKRFIQWIALHSLIVIGSFILHQSLSIAVDTMLWGDAVGGGFVYLLFNNPSLWIDVLGYGIFVSGFLLIDYQRRHRENEIRYSEIEADLVKVQLNEVRSRIHPQFLFKTLEFIGELLKEGRNKDANRILSLLSDFLRITVYEIDKDEVSFADEMKFLEIYTAIETIRLAPSFSIEKDIPAPMMTQIVPNTILQPIIEEIVYGKSDRPAVSRRILLTAEEHSEKIEISVHANTEPAGKLSAEEFSSREVVAIIAKRIEYLYGGGAGISCTADRLGELKVTLTLPRRQKNGTPLPEKEH